jgi:SpoVK/Ycf46/Vps4 family AAA+-type ATPase
MEERHELEFRNNTIEMVSMLLREHSSVEALIKYILGRKQELREYNLEENSFSTSPSKKADKGNGLLIGPQGCGKTEVLRGIASDRRSIGIFAQASDFLTCWRGEAEKNPKRLFEAGLKIQRESKKQVFFLIDEIDTILNGDRGSAAFGGTNLATEFQVLMDGITSYPSLALWGATLGSYPRTTVSSS